MLSILCVCFLSSYGQTNIHFDFQIFRNSNMYNASKGFVKTGRAGFYDEGKGELMYSYVSNNKKENGVTCIGYFSDLEMNEISDNIFEVFQGPHEIYRSYLYVTKDKQGFYKFVHGVINKDNPNGMITVLGKIRRDDYIKIRQYLRGNISNRTTDQNTILGSLNLTDYNPQIETSPGDIVVNCLYYKSRSELMAGIKKDGSKYTDNCRFSWGTKGDYCWYDIYCNGSTSPQSMTPLGELKDLILLQDKKSKLSCVANTNKKGIVFADPDENLQQGIKIEFKSNYVIVTHMNKSNNISNQGRCIRCSIEDGNRILYFFKSKLNNKYKEDDSYYYFEK